MVTDDNESFTMAEIHSIKKSIFWTNMEVGKGSRVHDFTGDDIIILNTSLVVKVWKCVSLEPWKEISLKVWHESCEKVVLILVILDVKNSIKNLASFLEAHYLKKWSFYFYCKNGTLIHKDIWMNY